MKNKKCMGCRKESCDGCSLSPAVKIKTSKDTVGEGILLLQDEGLSGLGIAFDIGTTTIAAMLWDLKQRRQLAVRSSINPQRSAGGDVISRIAYAGKSRENAWELQRLLVEKMDELARDMTRIPARRVSVVGNTAMCEILLGLPLDGLSRAPFRKAYRGTAKRRGSELGFSFLGGAQILVLPSIDGYVGADALAVHTWVRRQDERSNVLAVDIGTNGEILLVGEKGTYACSAAAGPALEGAAVRQGMGAVAGAVEEVRILGSFPRQDLFCRTIGDAPPRGICGSGLMDALAVLRKLGVIEEDGYLPDRAQAGKRGVPQLVCRRLEEGEGERRILLTDAGHPVYLTAGDIRQLQLAKGAIRAGIEILLNKEGIQKEDLNHIYLAGAFGSCIKVESALAIGLLPDIVREKITHTGNCAGMGASMALLSDRVIKDMEDEAERIRHVELAGQERFQELFLQHMELERDEGKNEIWTETF